MGEPRSLTGRPKYLIDKVYHGAADERDDCSSDDVRHESSPTGADMRAGGSCRESMAGLSGRVKRGLVGVLVGCHRRPGLSPRVWGNLSTAARHQSGRRSIPTCVGEPATTPAHHGGKRVYPHVCGGTFGSDAGGKTILGLSPRVWGNLLALIIPTQRIGSIPTCVGETGGLGGLVLPHQGLSPRVWGNPDDVAQVYPDARSIPTCVGEPGIVSCVEYLHRVYPHVCGGTQQQTFDQGSRLGLSPRVWGNHLARRQQGGQLGSIPTCVGEPRRQHLGLTHTQVYPHVCGGTAMPGDTGRGAAGLSPRVWGNRAGRGSDPPGVGSIPTCVGEPTPAGARSGLVWVYPHVCGGTATPSPSSR